MQVKILTQFITSAHGKFLKITTHQTPKAPGIMTGGFSRFAGFLGITPISRFRPARIADKIRGHPFV